MFILFIYILIQNVYVHFLINVIISFRLCNIRRMYEEYWITDIAGIIYTNLFLKQYFYKSQQ